MTIVKPELFINGFWDWGILKGCFGSTHIEPTDVDGLVERNGHFLVIETKNPDVLLKKEQVITFTNLIKTKKFTVIVVWGKKDKPEEMMIYYPSYELYNHIGWVGKKKANLNDFRSVVKKWFNYVDFS